MKKLSLIATLLVLLIAQNVLADSKTTVLTAATAATTDDLIMIVDAPGTSPTNKKLTVGELMAGISAMIPAVTTVVSSGNISVTAANTYVICTGACDVTPLPPAAGVQLCVKNQVNSASIITMHALGASKYYEKTDGSVRMTANTAYKSSADETSMICIVGEDTNNYATFSSRGTWAE